MNKCVHFAAKLKKRCSYTLRFEVLFNKTSIRISYFFNAKKKLANRNTHRWQKSTYAKSIRRLWLMNKKKVRNPFPPSILIGHGNKTKQNHHRRDSFLLKCTHNTANYALCHFSNPIWRSLYTYAICMTTLHIYTHYDKCYFADHTIRNPRARPTNHVINH